MSVRRRRGAAARGAASSGNYVLEEQIGHLLRRAHQRASAIFAAELGDLNDITPTQFAALAKLRDLGQESQNELGRLTAMDPATIQGVIRRLTARHLVERSGDPGDRRRTKLRLSARGRSLVDRLVPLGVRVTTETLRPLRGRDRAQFLRLLKQLT